MENINQSLVSKIRQVIIEARRSVVRSINTTMSFINFEIGRLIIEEEQKGEDRAEYSKETLKILSKRLTEEFGKGYSTTNLEYMRKFYRLYQHRLLQDSYDSEKPQKASEIFSLSWSHYVFLLKIDNEDERVFYEIEASKQSWSIPELRRQYNSSFYERLALSRDKEQVKALSQDGLLITKPEDTLKDPYVLEFLGLKEDGTYSETDLETAIINKLEHFLLELGKGFLFEARQKRFTFEDKHFWVDLVFYNRFLRCFVLIDLKIGELTHQDLGQIQMYVNYYDRFVKTKDENSTVGIILCKHKNDSLVEITLPENNDQIFARKYQLYLPTKEELKKQLDIE